MKRIEKPVLRKKFWELMRAEDSRLEYKTYTRKVKDSEGNTVQKEYLMRPRELERTKIERVFNTVLNWYTDHFNLMVASMPANTYSLEGNLPSLLTTNPQIAHSAGCSDRTVRTMLDTLVDMGVLTRANKGSKKGIEIRFTAVFLWGESTEERQNCRELMVVPLTPTRKKFPNNNTFGKGTEIEITNKAGKVEKHGESVIEGQRDKQIAPQNASNQPDLALQTSEGEKHTGGAAAENYPHSGVENGQPAPVQYDEWTQKCRQATMQFWGYAYQKLYSQRSYDKETVRTILILIWKDVFHSFQHIRNEKELMAFLGRQTKKIDIAAKYYDYHPEAYLPDPHSIMVEGRGYFDKKNERGFKGLEAWLKAEEAQIKKLRADWVNPTEFKNRKIERLLQTARKDYEKLAIGTKPRVEVSTLDMVGLQQYYGVIFGQLGEKALRRFNELVIAMQKTDFKAIQKAKSKSKIYPEIVEVESWMSSFEGYYK
ncbi:hypothetical protein [Flectobacillus roseus]|uniref:hypothetical protein n=1 Tax=Flectobacillus roseus TaxID=502259 RepID=UPI0024B79263|nr:hypothetical protein [Flectobacillus roseus]MDI9871301.1 hypothetical protein [Flectobacillus roseus]